MARGKREDELKAQMTKRYEILLGQRTEIDAELKGLEQYLKAVGAIRTRRRGRRRKGEQAG